jgi:hypothetical protein
MFPLASCFGATGVAASVLLSTALLTIAQCLLAPTLRRRVLVRLATAGMWTTAGTVAGVVGENLSLGFAS